MGTHEHRSGGAAFALLLVFALGAVGCEAEVDEVPEIAEIESEPDELGVELDEELVFGPGDVGETFMVNGWVAGTPLFGQGFFVLTEWNRRLFVNTDQEVQAGTAVRVVGNLAAADVGVFEGWEAEAFGDDVEGEWDFERSYFLNASSVEPLEPGVLPATPPADQMGEPGTGPGEPMPPAGDTAGAPGTRERGDQE